MENYKQLQHVRHVGLVGGTFDPVHFGHLVIAEEVRASLHLDEMLFIPAGQPPHKQGREVTPAEHRLAMLELALASNPHFAISRIDIERSGPSYTVETLRLLRQQQGPEVAFYFVIGWDSLEDLTHWYNPEGILDQLAYLVAVHRPGYRDQPGYIEQLEARLPGLKEHLLTIPAPQLDISATDLRRRVAEGKPIKYQVPDAVEQYIYKHRLYRQRREDRKTYGTHAI